MPRTSLERLALFASGVFIADFASKQWALRHLAENADRLMVPGLHLAVVNNTRLAWGLESGGFELELTAIVTVALALMVVRICGQLTAVDASAPAMLGLLLGAGVANLADALVPPHGVVDFIALTSAGGRTTTFNIADLGAAAGLALCFRTAWRIGLTMRGRRVIPAAPRLAVISSGVPPMRQRLILSAGHALLAMCAFVWLYSMLIVWTPDAGRSAPNSLLCGVAVFAAAFLVSQARLEMTLRRERVPEDAVVAGLVRSFEQVVLDGSLAASDRAARGDASDGARDRLTPRPRAMLDSCHRPGGSSNESGAFGRGSRGGDARNER